MCELKFKGGKRKSNGTVCSNTGMLSQELCQSFLHWTAYFTRSNEAASCLSEFARKKWNPGIR